METSGIDGMKGGSESMVIYEGNLSGFDRKGAMRKDGEAFSAPSIYTDQEDQFLEMGQREKQPAKEDTHFLQAARTYGRLASFQVITAWYKLRRKPKAQYLYVNKK